MAISYTAETLLESARRRGQLTRAAGSLDKDDLLAMMDEELQTYIMSFLLQLREEYAVADYDFQITGGQAEWPLPPRAIGGKLRDVRVLANGSQYERLTRLEPERMLSPPTADGAPAAFYFKGNKIGFTPCGNASVRLSYFKRPGRLVLEADAAQITAINMGTGVLTLSNVPDEFVLADQYDFIGSQPLFDTQAMDVAPTAITTSSITFPPAKLPATLAVGDWVALSGESPIPQIPAEMHPLLAQRTVVKALEALGDARGEQFAKMALEEEKRLSHMLVDGRDQGSARYIINRNGPGWRRGAAWW